jgi:hypothetical protein
MMVDRLVKPALSACLSLYRSSAAREQIGVFVSHLTLNASLFVVLFVASVRMLPPEFAKLSLANNSVMQVANVLGLGLDYAAIKLSLEYRTPSYVAINLACKAALLLLGTVALLAWTLVAGFQTELLVGAAGAAVAFWAATAILVQSEQRYRELAGLNLRLAAGRILFGSLALLLSGWAAVILAVHILAQVPVAVATFRHRARPLARAIHWPDGRRLLTLSPLVFASGVLVSLLPLVTQGLLYARNDTIATASFGVVLIFTAPVHTLLATLQIYLLPQAVDRDLREIDAFGLGRGSIHVVVAGFLAALVLPMIPAALVLNLLYGERLPPVATYFLIYFGGQAITSAIGLYNVRAQRGYLVRLAVLVNAGRVGATLMLALWPGLGAEAVVAWSAAILAVGEVVLWRLLARAETVLRGRSSGPALLDDGRPRDPEPALAPEASR